MPPFHSLVKRLLLAGVTLPASPHTPHTAPERLLPLVAAVGPRQAAFNAEAVRYGNRYRSAFWAIYLLSPVAVLFAALPPAMGWDVHLHSYAWVWAVCELLVILTVAAIYWRGDKADWQGQWLAARTRAELAWYLPLVAPLVDFGRPHDSASWYVRMFTPGEHLRQAGDVDAMCAQLEPLARAGTAGAWQDPDFVRAYAQWAIGILEGQRSYHLRAGAENHALTHRVHRITGGLFFFTAVGAALHLVLHSLWLSLASVFFPALGAALHGALAQSEAYRLEQNAGRLVRGMAQATEEVSAALAAAGDGRAALRDAVQRAVALILDEHQDWHGTVRPHHIPLG